MRFIDLARKHPKRRWLRWARSVTKQLERATTKEERAEIIAKNDKVWKSLLPWLLKQSDGKCWFSEARDHFAFWHVEHFRPKLAARNPYGPACDGGYWWLAFDWTNFRLCGSVGNVKKGAYFPLRAETHVATVGDRNIKDEFPYLLDPVREEDPLLLTFDSTGGVAPLPDLDSWQRARVEESINRYRLQTHEPLRDGRRSVWARCVLEVNKCKNLLAELHSAPSASAKEQVRQQIQKLREMLSSKAEFSATAFDCLRSRPERWAQRLACEG